MEEEEEPTVVVFRAYKDGTVVALFPELPHSGNLCESYTLVGEGAGADFRKVQAETRPAIKSEYWHTKVVLERIGYKLRILQRVPWKVHSNRQKEARKLAREAYFGSGTKE
jgi:hypothetical protein